MNPILLSDQLDFNIYTIKTFHIFGIEFRFTNSLWNAMCIAIVLVIFAIVVNRKLRKVDPMKPQKGLIGILEVLIQMLVNNTVSIMGPKNKGFAAFYGSLMLYIMACNLSGLILWFVPYSDRIVIDFMRAPTADVAVTLSMALITFFMTQYFGLRSKGLKAWLKGFTEPIFVLTPINIIGEVANPISLSFRLFGNVLAGTIILGLYYAMLPMWAHLVTPALHFYFDVFAGILQSFVFMMLSMNYVGGAME